MLLQFDRSSELVEFTFWARCL